MWHGIIVDASLKDPARVALFTAFAKKVDDDWTIVGIEVEDSKLDESLMMIQHEMRDDVPFYSHLYNESELIVLFKNKLFRATIHSGSWGPITEYGEKLGISREQLDFVPRSFTHSATLLFFTFSRKLTTDHSDTLYGELEPGSGDGGIVSRLCQSPSNILLLHLSKANKSANSMPNPRKFFEAHSIIMVSFRTEEGLPFLPLRYINQVFLSALGRAYDLYGVKVCAFSFEANHAHLLLLVEDPEAIPPFVGYIKQESAHAINRLLNRRKRTIWCDGYDSPPLLHSDLALDKFAYVLLNPVKDQLVSSMEQYPGVSSYAMLMEDRHQLVTRRIYRDSIPALNDPHKPWIEEESFRFNLGERENNVTFKLFPYAWKECFPDTKDLSDQQIREMMLDRIGTYKDSLPKVQVNPHRLKRQSLLAQYAPRVFGRRSVCLSRIRELRNNFIATYKRHCAEAVEVFKRWKTGDLAPFPPGLFAPCLPRLANLAPGLTTG